MAPLGRALHLREREELVGEASGAHRRSVHALELGAHARGKVATQQQLEVHLQPCQRGSQLVRRVRKETLLQRARVVQFLEQPVERLDDRRDLHGRSRRA